MSDLTNDPKTAALLARAQNIMMKPATEWDVIAGESATVKGLYMNYALILAAIPALCMTLGNILFLHVNLLHAISSGLAQYILSLFGTAALALSVDMLVPQFNGVQNQVQAFKLAIYSATPGWIAGALFLLPQLRSIAGLIGLYGIYLFYIGVSKLMKVPQNNAVILTVIAFVITFVIMALASATIY